MLLPGCWGCLASASYCRCKDCAYASSDSAAGGALGAVVVLVGSVEGVSVVVVETGAVAALVALLAEFTNPENMDVKIEGLALYSNSTTGSSLREGSW